MVQSPNQTSQLLRPAQNIWLWKEKLWQAKKIKKIKKKANGGYFHKTQRDAANREKPLKGFTLESFTTEPNTAAAIWKAPRPHVKEIHVLLKASARGRDLQGSSPERRLEGTISTIFFLVSPLSSQCVPSSCSPSAVLQGSYRGAFTGVWCPSIYIWCLNLGGCHPGDAPQFLG